MNNLIPSDAPVVISDLGIEFEQEISFEKWVGVGEQLGRIARTSLFWVGDWLNFGQDRWNGGQKFQKIPDEQRERFDQAMKLTGLEYDTLQRASFVAQKIPLRMRSPKLSFEHHRLIARVGDEVQRKEWIKRSENSKLSTRRLRKSLNGERIVRTYELEQGEQDGRKTHLVWIKHLLRWWASVKDKPIHKDMTREQIESVIADFGPILGVLAELRTRAEKATAYLDEEY